MGIFVRLTVDFDQITTQQWESVYQETLVLAKNFPIPLSRLIVEEAYGEERYVRSRKIVKSEGTQDENWRVVGDLLSKCEGETFQFMRVPQSLLNKNNSCSDRHILFAAITKGYHESGVHGYKVFSEKTQGEPYHYFVLAVGILVENRFPQCALLHGDISKQEAERVIPWMNKLLGADFKSPIIFDSKRLWGEVSKLYQSEALIAKRCSGLSQGLFYEYELIFKYGSEQFALETLRTLLQTDIKKELIPVFSAWLESGRDMRQFVTESSHFVSYDSLLKSVFEKEFTVPIAQRNLRNRMILDKYGKKINEKCGVDSLLLDYIENIRAYGVDSYFVDSKQLLEVLVDVYPQSSEEIEKFIKARMCILERKYSKYQDLTIDKELDSTYSSSYDGFVAFIVATAKKQFKFKTDKLPIVEIAKSLDEYCKKTSTNTNLNLIEEFVAREEELKKLIVHTTFQNQICLSEDCWEKIDKEKRLEVLVKLYVMCCIPSRELNFSLSRRMLLEQSSLWDHLDTGVCNTIYDL